MAIAGIALSFFAGELLNYLSISDSKIFVLILQIMGSLYLGFALLNWMAKANLIGGIYSRPVAIGNFMHFVVSSIALLKFYFVNTEMRIALIAAIIYLLFAIAFCLVVFGNPKSQASKTG